MSRLHVSNDFHRAISARLPVPTLQYPTKRAFTERCKNLVHGSDALTELVLQVAVFTVRAVRRRLVNFHRATSAFRRSSPRGSFQSFSRRAGRLALLQKREHGEKRVFRDEAEKDLSSFGLQGRRIEGKKHPASIPYAARCL